MAAKLVKTNLISDITSCKFLEYDTDIKKLGAQLQIQLKKFSHQLQKHQSTEVIAAMSFYIALCMVPLSLLIISTLTILGLTDKISMTEQIKNIISPVVIDVIKVLNNDKNNILKDSFFSSLLSLSVLLFSASLLFNNIKKALRNKAKNSRFLFHILKQRLVAMFLTLIFLVTVTLSLILSVLFKSVELPQFVDFKWIQSFGSILAFVLLFLSIYKIALKNFISFRFQLMGAFLTALILQLGQYLFSFYISIVPLKTVYGPISIFVGFLLWCYLFSASVVLGAEVTHFLHQRA